MMSDYEAKMIRSQYWIYDLPPESKKWNKAKLERELKNIKGLI